VKGYNEPLSVSCSGVIDESERRHRAINFKRLEAGTFQQLDPASRADHASGSAGLELTGADLALLLNGIDLATARRRKRYTRSR
jgi:hypothetical protein